MNSQEFSTKLEGRVYSRDGDVTATHVSNISRNRGTITDANGFFTISVKLNDTLVFSAVQYKKKEVVISLEILKRKILEVPLEDALTQLNEVVVTPYNLTGDIKRDAARLKVDNVMTASTLGLPNANLKVKTQNERKLLEAKDGAYIKPLPLEIPFGSELGLNDIPGGIAINVKRILSDLGGYTKTLKNYIEIDKRITDLNRIRRVYHDSIYEQELKIPIENINDFMNFCEIDSSYVGVVASNDILRLWEFLERNSLVYRKNNNLD
jgi:hypothetical protein